MDNFFKTIKNIVKIILMIFASCSIPAFIIIPFLHNYIDHTLAQWLWYLSCVIFLIILIIGFKKDSSIENSILDKVENIGIFWLAPVIPSIFVFNYYDIDYVWHWVIFAYAFFLIPYSFYNLLVVGVIQNHGDKEKNKTVAINVIKYIALYWLFDLFYMAIFNNWLICKFVFGFLAILLISVNLIDVFLRDIKSVKFFFAIELICGLILSGYLIFIIPNEKLQTIVLAIVSALMGGIFTLLGVAWTIKKGDDDRKTDLHRMEEERKEEERKKIIPYIRLANEFQAHYAARVSNMEHLDFNKTDDVERIENNTYYAIMINHFTIKNISNSNIILKGICIDDKYHPFDSETLIECDGVGQIQFPINHWLPFAKRIEHITLIMSDILDNKYMSSCKPYIQLDGQPMKNIINDTTEYRVFSYTYTIESISLPKLVRDSDLFDDLEQEIK